MPTREEIDKAMQDITRGFHHASCPDDWSDCNHARKLAEAYREEHDKTPLTVDILRENGFDVVDRHAVRTFHNCTVKADGIYGPTVAEWWWFVLYELDSPPDWEYVPTAFQPTTLGELRLLICKIEGGAE